MLSVLQRHYHRFREANGETRKLLIRHRYVPKLVSSLSFPLRLVLAVLLRIALLSLKPVVHVRFGRMWSFSLGAWSLPTELYLCEKEAGSQPKHSLDIFYHFDRESHLIYPEDRREALVCNKQMDRMFRPKLHIFEFAQTLDNLNRMLPGGVDKFSVALPDGFDRHDRLRQFPTQIAFTDAEEERGVTELRKLGIDPGTPFICFHSRDSAYENRARRHIVAIYQDHGDSRFRNSSIRNYIPAAQDLTELGYYAVRMGKYPAEAIEGASPKIIDYGYQSHSDFMDLYLSAHCTMFVGQDSGMTSLPMIFRKPIAFVNVMPYYDFPYTGVAGSAFIPKKYYSAIKGRLLTLREIITDPRLFRYPGRTIANSQQFYDEIGLELLENSPEEISGLAMEMEQRLRGVYESSEEDEEMQRRFLSIIRSHAHLFPAGASYDYQRLRIGADFLRTHPDFLD